MPGLIANVLERNYVLGVVGVVAKLVLLVGQPSLAERAELLAGLQSVVREFVGLFGLEIQLVARSTARLRIRVRRRGDDVRTFSGV